MARASRFETMTPSPATRSLYSPNFELASDEDWVRCRCRSTAVHRADVISKHSQRTPPNSSRERDAPRRGERGTLTFVKSDEFDRTHPLCFEVVNFSAALAFDPGMHDDIGERPPGTVVGFDAEDKLVVARVGRAREKFRALGVGAGDQERLEPHNVPLESSRNQARDVFRDGHENFAGLVAALFAAVQLVFKVNGRNARFPERLGELHNRGESSMSAHCERG